MIPVLFVEKKSIYKTLDCDPWDAERDARNYRGSSAIVAHPPCRLWSCMKKLSTAPIEEKELALFAVEHIKQHGGVLEHPAGSDLWKHPAVINQGILLSVNQHWWGHLANKKTILFICGISLRDVPPVPLCFDAVTHVIDTSSRKGRTKKYISKSMRSYTPELFARWLIELAEIIEKKKLSCNCSEA